MGHVRTTAHALARPGVAGCSALLALSLLACGSPEPPKAPQPVVDEAPAEPPSTLPLAPVPPILLRDVGFRSPESALYDPVADVYLVSNVSGGPADTDNDGFISKVSPDGTLLELRWIDAATAKTTLNAPKGMALVGETLFVADIDVVRAFDRASGKALGDVAIPAATFLNDIAAGPDGKLYVSDTGVGKKPGSAELSPNGSDAVYVIDAQRSVKELIKNPELEQPNGLAVDNGSFAPGAKGSLIVAASSGQVYRLDAMGEKSPLGKPAGGLDGLVLTPGGRLIVSSWEASSVFISPASPASDGSISFEPLINELNSPADIGYDVKRRQLLVPLFRENALYIQELPGDVN
jgi:glucose/arabinose dehydrogenase